MRKLMVFNSISLDGFFADSHGAMDWAHNSDPEFDEYTKNNARGDAIFVFGRITYEMMASFWPTAAAIMNYPVVADRMNSASKIVFSKTLSKAVWNNTTLLHTDPCAEIQKLKMTPGHDMVIFGSGTIVAQLTQHGLIDEYQFIVVPVVLGQGRSLFDGFNGRLPLKLATTHAFKNGNVLLSYTQPMEAQQASTNKKQRKELHS